MEDRRFQGLIGYFSKGIFFTGAIDYDLFAQGQTSIVDQFMTALECRGELIDLFTKKIDPIQVQESCVSEFRKLRDKQEQDMNNLKLDMEKQLQLQQHERKLEKDSLNKNEETVRKEFEKKMQELEDEHREQLERIRKDKLCTIS